MKSTLLLTFIIWNTTVFAVPAPTTPPQKQEPVVIKGQEDPDYGPQILATFFTQLIPGLAKLALGSDSECPNAQLQGEGIQQFSNGVLNFMYLVTRKPQAIDEFLQDKTALADFFHEQETEAQECIQVLRKFVVPQELETVIIPA